MTPKAGARFSPQFLEGFRMGGASSRKVHVSVDQLRYMDLAALQELVIGASLIC